MWKRDYSGSVRRLIRDGVDSPLANLFVHAVRSVSSDADGLARARSATEACLYRRLESLPQTKGRFALNTSLPIAFDGTGMLEVDLLCVDARLAVELDGAQHLSDPIAYRRDRRKDQLLQENGYFVLRFLAEDVGRRTAGRVALAATFTKATTPDGERWMFQDVHPGGAAAAAGIRPGDVLLSVAGRDLTPPTATPFTLGERYKVVLRRPDGSTASRTLAVPHPKDERLVATSAFKSGRTLW